MTLTKALIPSSRGTIAAVIHRPSLPTDKLAILCPGYLDSKDYPHLVRLAEDLCALGHTVVRFDPSGTWESSSDISDYTTTHSLEDIHAVLETVLKEYPFTTILLGGHSRGGTLALLYAAQDPRISQVFAIMSSGSRALDDERSVKWKTRGIRISKRDLPDQPSTLIEFRVPYSYVEDRERYDVLAQVTNLRIPSIFIAGEQDEIVSPARVEELYRRAPEPKKLAIIPNIGHDYRRHEHEIALVNETLLNLLS